MSANRSDQIPLPFVTAAIAFLISLYFRNHLITPTATVAGFLAGVWVLYIIGKWEIGAESADDSSFLCPNCGTRLHVGWESLSSGEMVDSLAHLVRLRAELAKTKKENR